MVPGSALSPFHCNCKRLLPYPWQHTISSILADIESAICFPCGRSSCPVIYNISARGDQSTSLANLLVFTQKNELPHLFCTWEEQTFSGASDLSHKGEIQLDDAGVGVKPVYTSST
jgi:hypothetical protein